MTRKTSNKVIHLCVVVAEQRREGAIHVLIVGVNGDKAIYLPKALLFHTTSVRHQSTSYIAHKSLARTRTSNSRNSCNAIRVKERKGRWRLSRASRASPLRWLRPVNSYSPQIYGDFGLFPAPPAVFLLSS